MASFHQNRGFWEYLCNVAEDGDDWKGAVGGSRSGVAHYSGLGREDYLANDSTGGRRKLGSGIIAIEGLFLL